MNHPPEAFLGWGVDCTDHRDPSHASARARLERGHVPNVPTAMHLPVSTHDTPLSESPSASAELTGGSTMLHALPSHRSARVFPGDGVEPAYPGRCPTAMQLVLVAQDTPLSVPPTEVIGARAIRQPRAPRCSARVSRLP
jgi:hypothetical protein